MLELCRLGTAPTTGSISGNVTDNGTLAFDRSDAVTFGGVISGSGGLVQMGSVSEPLVLTGINTYTGGTTINSGTTLQLGNGVTDGNITGNVSRQWDLGVNPVTRSRWEE